MTSIRLAALIVFACALGAAHAVPARDAAARSIAWVDAESGEVLFTAADMVRFDWQKQTFELKRNRAMDLEARLSSLVKQHRGFLVRDRRGVIYRGRFISGFSSLGYSGPTIVIEPLVARGDPVLRIDGGYPGGDSRGHFAPRLFDELKKVGIIRTIRNVDRPALIDSIHFGWAGDRDGLRVRAEIFSETMRVGTPVRMHLYFLLPEGCRPPGAEMAIVVIVSANQGRYRGAAQMAGPAPDHLKNGAYVFRFDPWKPASASRDRAAKPGPAQVWIEVLLRKKTGNILATVKTIQLGPRDVAIL